MIKEFPCITCPMSCRLVVEIDDQDQLLSITGNTCPRGEVYARNELTHPVRMLTTTIRITNAIHPLLPIMSSEAVPKERIFDIIEACKNIVVSAPIQVGDIVCHHPLGLSVDLIATRCMQEVNHESKGTTSH